VVINRFLFSFLLLVPSLAFAQPDQFNRVMACNQHLVQNLEPDRQRVLTLAEQLHHQYVLLEENLGPKFLRINLGSTLGELDQRLSRYAEMAFNTADSEIRIGDAREAIENMRRSLNDSLNSDQRKLIDTVREESWGVGQPQGMQQLHGSNLNVDLQRYGNPHRPQDPPREKP
jgi:hypothetical protein